MSFGIAGNVLQLMAGRNMRLEDSGLPLGAVRRMCRMENLILTTKNKTDGFRILWNRPQTTWTLSLVC